MNCCWGSTSNLGPRSVSDCFSVSLHASCLKPAQPSTLAYHVPIRHASTRDSNGRIDTTCSTSMEVALPKMEGAQSFSTSQAMSNECKTTINQPYVDGSWHNVEGSFTTFTNIRPKPAPPAPSGPWPPLVWRLHPAGWRT